jgi:branched-chain amino acid transport system permease protein
MAPSFKSRLPRGRTIAVVIGLLALFVPRFVAMMQDAAWRQLALFAMVNVVVALSLNVINGMAGQFSIGHAGFVGIGAYTGAIVAGNLHVALGGGSDFPFAQSFLVMPPTLLAAGLCAGFFGFLVGLPSLRLKGDYLAIVTLGFAEIFRLLIATARTGGVSASDNSNHIVLFRWFFNLLDLLQLWLSKLGGQNGYAGPSGTGVAQYAGPFWVVGVVVIAILLSWRLKFSGWGRALRALREDEIASAAVGVDPTRYKVTSFVIAAAGAGVAGAMLSSLQDGNPTVQPDQFGFAYSFDAITMVILGGSGSVTGAVVGGIFVTFTVKLIEQLQGLESVQAFKAVHPGLDLNALRMVIYAAILIGLMILRPEGLFGEREIVRAPRRSRPKGPAKPEIAGHDGGDPHTPGPAVHDGGDPHTPGPAGSAGGAE